MTLQGDLDTFALPDVLRLLAGAGKTGHLELVGDRGRGVAVLSQGGIVGGEVQGDPNANEPADVIFELLRFRDGSFCFDADSVVVENGFAPAGVDELLATAQEMLTEWYEVESVVPSLDAWLTLAPEITTDEIIVSRGNWQVLATLGGGGSVRALAGRLGLTELAVCRVIRDLVEAGTLVVGEESPASTDEPVGSLGENQSGSARERLDAMAAAFAPEKPADALPTADLPEPLPGQGTAFDSPDPFARRETLAAELAPIGSLGHADDARDHEDEVDDDDDDDHKGVSGERGPLVRFLSSVKN